MEKTIFHNELTFQVTLYLARLMMAEKLISEKEYFVFVDEMLRKYQPITGDLYTCYLELLE